MAAAVEAPADAGEAGEELVELRIHRAVFRVGEIDGEFAAAAEEALFEAAGERGALALADVEDGLEVDGAVARFDDVVGAAGEKIRGGGGVEEFPAEIGGRGAAAALYAVVGGLDEERGVGAEFVVGVEAEVERGRLVAEGAPLAGPVGALEGLVGGGGGDEEPRLRGGGLTRADLGDEAVADVALERADDAEIVRAAKDTEDVGVAEIEEVEFGAVVVRDAAVLVAVGPRGAGGKRDEAAGRAVVGALRAEVHVAGDGVAVHVGRGGLDDFRGGERAGADLAEVNVAVADRGAAGDGDLGAVDEERGKILRHAADVDGADLAAGAVDGDTGEALEHFADGGAGIAEGVDGGDGADVGGLAFFLNRGGLALTEALHDKFFGFVDDRVERDVADDGLAGGSREREALVVEAGIGDDEARRAGGDGQAVVAVAVGGGAHVGAFEGDDDTGEDIAGGEIGHAAGDDRGGVGGRRRATQEKREEEAERDARARQQPTGGANGFHGGQ